MPTLKPATVTCFQNLLSGQTQGPGGAAVWSALQTLVQNSQALVNLMDEWAANDNGPQPHIVWDANGKGIFTTAANTPNGQIPTITLGSLAIFPSPSATVDAQILASGLAHELSHALLDYGLVVRTWYPATTTNNPLQFADEELQSEAIAYNSQYQIPQQLGLLPLTGKGPTNMAGPGTFQPPSGSQDAQNAYARNWAAAAAPSNAPGLSYLQFDAVETFGIDSSTPRANKGRPAAGLPT